MSDNTGPPPRKRARQACLACNARRVKCDVTERQPCQNCVAGNVTCETRESRRGKHPRPNKKRHSLDSSASGARSQHDDEVAGAQVLASLHRDINATQPEAAIKSFLPGEQPNGPRPEVRLEEDGDVFLGEATSLRYVHDAPDSAAPTSNSPDQSARLRYAVPSAVKAESLIPDWEVQRRERRKEHLRQDGALSFPDSSVVEGLLKAYFRWFHPCFAVVDEMDIWAQHSQGTLSPLLLQAMLFVGVLHCEDSVLLALGEGTRHRAKYIFYMRAKDIYDAEVEQKKITVIQSLFLMSFWRAGALLEKDTRHWLAVAISLAQTKALHRSAGNADSQAAKLRRRIWWSLYTRDRQCAAALGLPNRVRDEDCDFESLERSDFDHAYHDSVPQKAADQYITYAMGMTELAKLLGQIVHSGYLPNKRLTSVYREQIRSRLAQWRDQLPIAMQPDNNSGEPPSFYANMQHLAYNNLLILLYRSGYIGAQEEDREVDGSIAITAASRNTRIVEDMLSDETLRHGQVHVITNLFNTLCMHTIQLRRSVGSGRTVAVSRAKICLNGLQELQKTWEVTNWVLELFFQYLDRSTAESLQMQDQQQPPSTQPTNARPLEAKPYVKTPQPSTPLYPAMQAPYFNPGTSQSMLDAAPATPWESDPNRTDQFLFSSMEHGFAFGEGEIAEWNPTELEFNASFFPSANAGMHNFWA
ncbi:uncharacterized protein LTR77_002208 [Saxophila tyrrhenica]|uniref:Zn(2)-C6 fungal-type domain-containing protein n=1 Tax=Saxophila tyrrhenica TaxID=1690608 RepID=A0AAV9PHV5_9PEZI|nr:hypothetical protein LTR77_002208 [Saxophila tyrrhenica]